MGLDSGRRAHWRSRRRGLLEGVPLQALQQPQRSSRVSARSQTRSARELLPDRTPGFAGHGSAPSKRSAGTGSAEFETRSSTSTRAPVAGASPTRSTRSRLRSRAMSAPSYSRLVVATPSGSISSALTARRAAAAEGRTTVVRTRRCTANSTARRGCLQPRSGTSLVASDGSPIFTPLACRAKRRCAMESLIVSALVFGTRAAARLSASRCSYSSLRSPAWCSGWSVSLVAHRTSHARSKRTPSAIASCSPHRSSAGCFCSDALLTFHQLQSTTHWSSFRHSPRSHNSLEFVGIPQKPELGGSAQTRSITTRCA